MFSFVLPQLPSTNKLPPQKQQHFLKITLSHSYPKSLPRYHMSSAPNPVIAHHHKIQNTETNKTHIESRKIPIDAPPHVLTGRRGELRSEGKYNLYPSIKHFLLLFLFPQNNMWVCNVDVHAKSTEMRRGIDQ